ncbi:MAG: bacillithiol system redox-active protein YtxJ [Bacteroidota bacterium]
MGFLDRVFSLQAEDVFEAWKVLEEEQQLEQLIQSSYHKIVVIFKHSIRCGTSAMIKHQLEQNWNFEANELDFYYLDLINYRPISNAIASRFDVVHQSPQIIVLRSGRAIFSTSHHAISVGRIRMAIKQYLPTND